MIVGCKCALYDKNFFVFEGGHKAQLDYDSGREGTHLYLRPGEAQHRNRWRSCDMLAQNVAN